MTGLDTARPLLVRGARILDPSQGLDERGDLLVENGVISAVGASAADQGAPDGAEIVDANGLLLIPGLVDIRVHMGEPGSEHRETIRRVLELMLVDNRQAWDLQSDGSYVQRSAGDGPELGTHRMLLERYRESGVRIETGTFPVVRTEKG